MKTTGRVDSWPGSISRAEESGLWFANLPVIIPTRRPLTTPSPGAPGQHTWSRGVAPNPQYLQNCPVIPAEAGAEYQSPRARAKLRVQWSPQPCPHGLEQGHFFVPQSLPIKWIIITIDMFFSNLFIYLRFCV